MTRSRNTLGLVVLLLLCFAVSGIGGAATSTSVGTWYQTLQKPSFNPPSWIFGPVWTALYIFMAIAGWRVWRLGPSIAGRRALVLFAVQLLLNVGWSLLFFGAQRIDLALAEIVVLLATIVGTAVLFGRLDRWAGALFVPYVLWVGFATLLNASIWWLNRAT